MEIKQLRYFIEVAKREHISETALELNIAQPSNYIIRTRT
ncbi:hypothetical protein HMPREF2111_02538 [Staphylococcus aureus 917]|nr:hypothetical protein HMPREF1625_02797 [Staphylococcus aureus 880]KIE14299.1 hypothetical protein HMPREF2111_02538 [Staphylococcus aureus 917]